MFHFDGPRRPLKYSDDSDGLMLTIHDYTIYTILHSQEDCRPALIDKPSNVSTTNRQQPQGNILDASQAIPIGTKLHGLLGLDQYPRMGHLKYTLDVHKAQIILKTTSEYTPSS